MSHTYEQMVREAVRMREPAELNEEEVIQLLLRTKPLIFNGHFELLSKLHSNAFFRFISIAQYPFELAKISKEMVSWIERADLGQIDVVLSTSRAGMFFAYEIARALNKKYRTRAVYAKSNPKSGYPTTRLVEGFSIRSRERVFIVNDLITTGKGIKTLIELAESYYATIPGICVFAVRKSTASRLASIRAKYNFHSIIELQLDDWEEDKCDLCKKNIPVIRSTDINSLTLETPVLELLKQLPGIKVA